MITKGAIAETWMSPQFKSFLCEKFGDCWLRDGDRQISIP